MSEEPGHERVIAGRYRLLSPLGEGGMGTVWRARDGVLHREVAVKEVHAPAGLPAPEVERMYARLEREAWAAARVANRKDSDPGWKTLSFPAGGGKTKQDSVTATTESEEGTFNDEISVEVRGPVKTESNTVPFSVTCEKETPTNGTSPSTSANALPPSGAFRPRS